MSESSAPRVAFVTGASKGIGAAVAVSLAASGHRVAVGYGRDQEGAARTCEAVEARGGEALPVPIRVDEPAVVETAFGRIEDGWGPVEILVNNAGATRDGLFVRMQDDAWRSVLATNLDGAFHTARRATKSMMRGRFGRIVSVSSVVALAGGPGQANYSAAKAGLVGLTRSLARELGGRGITANVVLPGPIETAMTETLGEERREELAAQVPSGRFGTPEEVAAAVSFLASDEASYVNGAVLAVDGGAAMGH